MSRRQDVLHLSALGFCLGVSFFVLGASRQDSTMLSTGNASNDRTHVADSQRHLLPIQSYQRIVSLSPVADAVLLELAESNRVLNVTTYAVESGSRPFRFAGRPTLGSTDNPEPILALRPDLVLVHDFGGSPAVSRLRQLGLNVFDLGPTDGLQSFLLLVENLGTLIQEPARTQTLIQSLQARLSTLESGQNSQRPTALYVTLYGDKVFGAGAKTSYDDTLRLSGLDNEAARAGRVGFPQYPPEELLAFQPEVLITKPGMGPSLCRSDRLGHSPACQNQHIIEVPAAILDDPGFGIIETAEWIRHRLADFRQGPPPPRATVR
jgi:ABC-type Fe3+-hydroxamate transport system substrate-binding protein